MMRLLGGKIEISKPEGSLWVIADRPGLLYNAVKANAFFVLYNKEPVAGVSLRLTDYADSIVEIDDIEAHKPGEGSGSKAMRRITKIADETGTILFLVPRGDSRVDVPEDDSEWRGNIFHRLAKFYERFGFELSPNGDTMYRYPRH